MKLNLNPSQKRILIIAAILTFIGTIAIHLTFNYMDGQTLMAWSVNNWDLLVEGRIGDFYTDKDAGALGFLRGASPEAVHIEGSSNPLMFIPQMLWCFPIWVTHYFNGNTYVGTLACVYWYKLFLILMTGFCSWCCFRIVRRISGDDFRSALAGLIVMGSSEVLLSTGYSAQDEIIYLAFTMLAIERLLAGKYKQFIIWAVVAVTLCPLVILPLAVIIVLRQKSILRIIGELVLMLVPSGLWSVLSHNMIRSYAGADHMGEVFDYLYIPLVIHGKASAFIVFMVILLFTCYIRPECDDRKLIWFASLPMIWLSYLTDSYFYRLLLYIPFLAIMITVDDADDLSLKVLLITLLEYARFFAIGIDNKIVLNTYYTVDADWVRSICAHFGSDKYSAYEGLVEQFFVFHPSLAQMAGVLNGVIVAILIILLWITWSPQNERKSEACRIKGLNIYLTAYSLCIPIYLLMFWHYAMKCF